MKLILMCPNCFRISDDLGMIWMVVCQKERERLKLTEHVEMKVCHDCTTETTIGIG